MLGALVLSAFGPSQPVAAAPTVPAGFTDSLFATVGNRPTDLAFTPDGRMLIAIQTGRLRVVQGGVLKPSAAIDLALTKPFCSNLERGLLGVTVDPGFATNGYV